MSLSNRVMIPAEKGEHHYNVYYAGTLIQKVSTDVSIVTTGAIIIYLIKKKFVK